MDTYRKKVVSRQSGVCQSRWPAVLFSGVFGPVHDEIQNGDIFRFLKRYFYMKKGYLLLEAHSQYCSLLEI
jgi:hypothetical protein